MALVPASSHGADAFNGGTITSRLEIDGAQAIQGLLRVKETAKTPGSYGLEVTDALSNLQFASTTTPDGFPILIVGGPNGVAAPFAVWADFDNDSNAELNVDASHNVSIAQSSSKVGFYGATPAVKPTVIGAKLPSDVALASLLTALATLGLITNSTT